MSAPPPTRQSRSDEGPNPQGDKGASRTQRNSMSDKRQKNQLRLAFTEERGVKLRWTSGRDRIEFGEMRNRTSSYHEQLMEEVCERKNCWQAYNE